MGLLAIADSPIFVVVTFILFQRIVYLYKQLLL